ncbi:hypothetical protein ACP4OV_015165 [Aristida adscensionis]
MWPLERFVEKVIKKLPLLKRLVLDRGSFTTTPEVMHAFLDHCPHLEVLHVGGCCSTYTIGGSLRARCKQAIKDLRMPMISLFCKTILNLKTMQEEPLADYWLADYWL